jgi:hypothetical protein
MSCEYFDTTDADIILRSVDGREFRAHKTILSQLASPVFRNMVSLPQPPSSEPALDPVVDLSETGEVLGMFLRFIYPVPLDIIGDLRLMDALVAAADKYEAGIILDIAGSWLEDPENIRENPLFAYAIACSSPTL